jgi:hypothetical protein
MIRMGPDGDRIQVGERFAAAFQRTLRVPEDGRVYPLPPGLGRLPIHPVAALGGAVPDVLRQRGGFIVPLHRREALWIAFLAAAWKPNAVQVGVGGVNAVSGGPWEDTLSSDPQNYVVCPDQPWLDGVNAGAGHIRQFVAVPFGSGRSIESQLRGGDETGGIQLRVYEPKPGRFPDRPPEGPADRTPRPARGFMGLGAGGKIAQRIHPDPYGIETWDPASAADVFVHLVGSDDFRALTGRPAPPSPISAETYAKHGLPWFEYYDEAAGDVPPAPELAGLAGTADDVDAERSVPIDPAHVKPIPRPRR